jgi:hypothetical protein
MGKRYAQIHKFTNQMNTRSPTYDGRALLLFQQEITKLQKKWLHKQEKEKEKEEKYAENIERNTISSSCQKKQSKG